MIPSMRSGAADLMGDLITPIELDQNSSQLHETAPKLHRNPAKTSHRVSIPPYVGTLPPSLGVNVLGTNGLEPLTIDVCPGKV